MLLSIQVIQSYHQAMSGWLEPYTWIAREISADGACLSRESLPPSRPRGRVLLLHQLV
jgi:hypothetical protein